MGSWASLVAQKVKNPPAMQETWVQSLGWEDPLEKWISSILAYPLQYSCLENAHGQRSLAAYSPWDCKELDTTEQLSMQAHYIVVYFLAHFAPYLAWEQMPLSSVSGIWLSSHGIVVEKIPLD